MDNGLMKKEPLENLGFTEDMEWEYEDKMQKDVVREIMQKEELVRQRVMERKRQERAKKSKKI